jgi:hypothetical protein
VENRDTFYLILGVIAICLTLGLLLLAPASPAAPVVATREAQLQALHPDWTAVACQRVADRQVGVGMTPAMVSAAWGEPAKLIQSDTEQWYVYSKGKTDANTLFSADIGEGLSTHVVFREGRVAEIREFDIAFANLDVLGNVSLEAFTLMFGLPHHTNVVQGRLQCVYESYAARIYVYFVDGRFSSWSRYAT